MMELRTRRGVGLDAFRPRDGHRLAGAAEMRADQLGGPVGRAARPGPAGVIHVVGLRAAKRIEPAEFLQRLDVLRDLGRNAVLRELLGDGAVQAFRRGAVVAPDVKDQRVVEFALPLDLGDHPAGVVVGMLGEPGEDFHQPALERLFILGDRVPRRHRWPAAASTGRLAESSPCSSGALEDTLAVLVPAVIELAFILVGPLLHDVMRAVRGARRPVHEERLVGA